VRQDGPQMPTAPATADSESHLKAGASYAPSREGVEE
jgi:hypothetical protein